MSQLNIPCVKDVGFMVALVPTALVMTGFYLTSVSTYFYYSQMEWKILIGKEVICKIHPCIAMIRHNHIDLK